MIPQMSAEEWSEYLRSLARPVIDRDETVVHTPAVGAFLRWLRGERLGAWKPER